MKDHPGSVITHTDLLNIGLILESDPQGDVWRPPVARTEMEGAESIVWNYENIIAKELGRWRPRSSVHERGGDLIHEDLSYFKYFNWIWNLHAEQ